MNNTVESFNALQTNYANDGKPSTHSHCFVEAILPNAKSGAAVGVREATKKVAGSQMAKGGWFTSNTACAHSVPTVHYPSCFLLFSRT